MRTLLFFFFFCAVACRAALAQQIQFGLQKGFGVAQLSNYWEAKNDRWGADWVKCPLWGGFAAYYVGKRAALGLELNRVTKGNARYGVINRYHYAQFSPYLKWDFFGKNDSKWVGYGRLGGYFALLTDQTQEYREGSFAYILLLEYGGVDDYDYGLNAGLGAGYELDKNIRLGLEARAEQGLLNVFGFRTDDASIRRNISAWLMLSLSYTLPSVYPKL